MGRTLRCPLSEDVVPARTCVDPTNFPGAFLMTIMLPFRRFQAAIHDSLIDQICRRNYGFDTGYAG